MECVRFFPCKSLWIDLYCLLFGVYSVLSIFYFLFHPIFLILVMLHSTKYPLLSYFISNNAICKVMSKILECFFFFLSFFFFFSDIINESIISTRSKDRGKSAFYEWKKHVALKFIHRSLTHRINIIISQKEWPICSQLKLQRIELLEFFNYEQVFSFFQDILDFLLIIFDFFSTILSTGCSINWSTNCATHIANRPAKYSTNKPTNTTTDRAAIQ